VLPLLADKVKALLVKLPVEATQDYVQIRDHILREFLQPRKSIVRSFIPRLNGRTRHIQCWARDWGLCSATI